MSLKKFKKKQIKQSIYINQYNIELVYQPEKENQKVNILSQREQNTLSKKNKRI